MLRHGYLDLLEQVTDPTRLRAGVAAEPRALRPVRLLRPGGERSVLAGSRRPGRRRRVPRAAHRRSCATSTWRRSTATRSPARRSTCATPCSSTPRASAAARLSSTSASVDDEQQPHPGPLLLRRGAARRGVPRRRPGDLARSTGSGGRCATSVGQMAGERIAWLPTRGELTAVLDGRSLPVVRRSAQPNAEPGRRARIVRTLRRRAGAARRRVRHGALVGRSVPTLLRHRRLPSSSTRSVAEYRDAWVFTDRNDLAQDNAEHLYRWVSEHRPEINAWFVVDRDTTDWPRLEREGFRLVEYGTPEHVLLIVNSVELISSHTTTRSAINPLEHRAVRQAAAQVHVPPARSHQGRPVTAVERTDDRSDDHRHRRRVPVDRRRRNALHPHRQGSAPHRASAPRPAVAARRGPLVRRTPSGCCS